MEEWYLIVGINKELNTYETVMCDMMVDGVPVSEPLFFESLEEAQDHARTLDYMEIEIYKKVEGIL